MSAENFCSLDNVAYDMVDQDFNSGLNTADVRLKAKKWLCSRRP